MRVRLALLASVLVGCGGGGSDDGAGGDAAGVPDTTITDSAIGETAVDAGTDAPRDTAALTDATDSSIPIDGSDASLGTLLFNGDFEPGDLSQWPGIERCAKDRITVYSAATAPTGAPPPHQGKYAAHYHVLDTDVSPCTSTDNPRAQLSTALTLMGPGADVWERWAIYVPADFPEIKCASGTCKNGTWLLFQEDYGPPWDGAPSIGWDVLNVGGVDSFAFARGQYGSDTPWHQPLVKAKWIEFLVHKKLSNTPTGGGFVEAWFDGAPITFTTKDPASCTTGCTHIDMQTMHSSMTSVAFFLNAYRALGMTPTVDLYFDVVRIGTTRASVELP